MQDPTSAADAAGDDTPSTTRSSSKSSSKSTTKKTTRRKTATKADGEATSTTRKKTTAKKAASKSTTRKKTTKKAASKKKTTTSKTTSTTKKKTARKAPAKKAASKKKVAPTVAAEIESEVESTPETGPDAEVAGKTSSDSRSDAGSTPTTTASDEDAADPIASDDAASPTGEDDDDSPKKKRRRRGGRRRRKDGDEDASDDESGADARNDADASAEGDDDSAKKERGGSRKKTTRGRGRRDDSGVEEVEGVAEVETGEADAAPPKDRIVVVNEVADLSTRIAILDAKGRLDEYAAEHASSATVVGNIYKARVTNVEAAIQAAFVDFGVGQSGFLHISDLHPQYFPSGDKTERVGKKIPRRERPPMQDALKKGQEILVQVLKQGIGSKGPTVTSYLSIPGRLLVMMPGMDRVGVSRKVDDPEQRKAMRQILDSLDLPEGFGFIVRTAGFSATLAELKRDAAYLTRLWEQMDRRNSTTGAPCLLYSESDLLIRTLRDVVDSSVKAVVIDDRDAFRRAKGFLDVIAPGSSPDLRWYDDQVPIFHRFGVEHQVEAIHAREVPLKSGGALVIEQTEALVAIDVNSGRSRSARDAETNAYRTNQEAVDEIARQLRLRDLGGLIVNDLIDMRLHRHRRDIEHRFRDALRRDRAKTTVLPIGEFGILEMTRQRMRPSMRKAHFAPCTHCHGCGELRRPDLVAADTLRHIAMIFSSKQVRRVELVCATPVAAMLISTARGTLNDLENEFGKKVDVRINEAFPADRVDLYAYDERGADVEVARLPAPSKIDVKTLPTDASDEVYDDDEGGRRGRRRGRRRKPAPADATATALSIGLDEFTDDDGERSAIDAHLADGETSSSDGPKTDDRRGDRTSDGDGDGDGEGPRRKRRRRGGRGRRKQQDGETTSADTAADTSDATADAPATPIVEAVAMRVFALARELDVTSRQIIDRIEEEGSVTVKNHMSNLAADAVTMVRGWFAPAAEEAPDTTASTESETSADVDPGSDDGSNEPTSTDSSDERRESGHDEDGEPRKKRRRRRRGRGRGRGRDGEDGGEREDRSRTAEEGSDDGADRKRQDRDGDRDERDDDGDRPKRRRGGRGRRGSSDDRDSGTAPDAGPTPRESTPEKSAPEKTAPKVEVDRDGASAAARKPPRSLYGGRMRRVGAATRDPGSN